MMLRPATSVAPSSPAGLAYGFELDVLPWEQRAGQRYADAEFEARKARRGLWPMWLGEK